MKKDAPPFHRNKEAICDALKGVLPDEGTVLEVASGSGQHAVYFASKFPDLIWKPSDVDDENLLSIKEWGQEACLPNWSVPFRLDVTQPWPEIKVDAIINLNMIHISPWAVCEGLMHGAGKTLPADGVLYLYGPFWQAEHEKEQSNLDFEQWLKGFDESYGIRNLEDVQAEADKNGLVLEKVIEMPANNLSVIFRKS